MLCYTTQCVHHMMVMATTSGMLLFSLAYCCVLFKVVNAASPVLLSKLSYIDKIT